MKKKEKKRGGRDATTNPIFSRANAHFVLHFGGFGLSAKALASCVCVRGWMRWRDAALRLVQQAWQLRGAMDCRAPVLTFSPVLRSFKPL